MPYSSLSSPVAARAAGPAVLPPGGPRRREGRCRCRCPGGWVASVDVVVVVSVVVVGSVVVDSVVDEVLVGGGRGVGAVSVVLVGSVEAQSLSTSVCRLIAGIPKLCLQLGSGVGGECVHLGDELVRLRSPPSQLSSATAPLIARRARRSVHGVLRGISPLQLIGAAAGQGRDGWRGGQAGRRACLVPGIAASLVTAPCAFTARRTVAWPGAPAARWRRSPRRRDRSRTRSGGRWPPRRRCRAPARPRADRRRGAGRRCRG